MKDLTNKWKMEKDYLEGMLGMIKKDGRLVKWFWYQMYECSRLEKFLSNMAKQGWMIEKFVGNKFVFQPCSPIDMRFSAELFDQSSASSVFQNDATLTYYKLIFLYKN
ncbi:MAG: DUF2812 domain-containing protein [Lachnotalea sp.]